LLILRRKRGRVPGVFVLIEGALIVRKVHSNEKREGGTDLQKAYLFGKRTPLTTPIRGRRGILRKKEEEGEDVDKFKLEERKIR